MEAFVVEVLNRFGYLGIFLLIALESLFPPLPAESVMLITGFASQLDGVEINAWLVALAATLGSLAGALILYFLGSFLTHKRLDSWLKKHFPRYPGLRRGLNKTFAFFYKYNQSAVFFGRFLPVVRPLISWPAGMTRMPLVPFATFTFIACGLFNTFYVFMGNTVGIYKQQLWNFVMEHIVWLSALAITLLLIAAIILIRKFREDLAKKLRRKERFRQARQRRAAKFASKTSAKAAAPPPSTEKRAEAEPAALAKEKVQGNVQQSVASSAKNGPDESEGLLPR